MKNGELSDILAEGSDINASLALGDADGFAVVKDSGYRRKSFNLGDVSLNGMMPKAAEAEADDVAEQYADFDEEGLVLAAFDISIEEGGASYQPDEAHPVNVAIAVEAESEDADLHLWHIHDDGTREEITGFTFENGKVEFEADGFSVYVVTQDTKLRTYRFFTFDEYGDYVQYAF